MLKVYSSAPTSIGQDPQSWEQNWHHADLSLTLPGVGADFLSRYFRRHLSRTGLNYEGGCGAGQYVVHYQRLGYQILGADFTGEALRAIRRFDVKSQVHRADVTRIPLRDGSVQFYFSGGVVEHFEEGPYAALAEARRVLSPSGRLLVTVPFANMIRRAAFQGGEPRLNWEGHHLKRVDGFGRDVPPAGTRFMEYRFTEREFKAALESVGFEPLVVRPFSLLAGELSPLLAKRPGKRDGHGPGGTRQEPDTSPGRRRSGLRRYAYDVLSTEKPSGFPFRPLVRALNRVAGHMLMAVCRPSAPQGNPSLQAS